MVRRWTLWGIQRFPMGRKRLEVVGHRRSKGLHELSDCSAPKTSCPCDWTIHHKKLFEALKKAHDHVIAQ